MNLTRKTVHTACIAIGTAAFLGASGATAQPMPIDTIDEAVLLSTVNEETVAPALAVVTGNQLVSVDADGNPMLIATATNGLRFEVRFRACEAISGESKRHCKGVFIVGVWDALPESDRAAFADLMTGFSRQNPAVNAGLTGDGSPYLVRYVIADFGTPQGNMVSEFANYIRSATEFQNAIGSLYTQ
ncbi:hypothetical protein [Erythrobacter sp. THAF29]|uniref:hypothetical protein n=1 Tax=Erythrobacter sp. THAF29 TaxID=2587851 RepID=UPI001268EFA8|nr:hypothetical protein [Erythrobacter sp. THAF29]QFT78475.1 hypothetical protein FIU90_13065 [Erythrobacter sp. THAF29]